MTRHPGRWNWVVFVLFYALLTNIPFWLARHELRFFHAGFFCVEYAIVGLLALYLPRPVSAFLLFLAIAADMTAAVCETYYLTPEECIRNFGTLHAMSGPRLAVLASIIASVIIAVIIAAILPVPAIRREAGRRTAGCLIAFIALCMVTDLVFVVYRQGTIPNPLHPVPPPDTFKLGSRKDLRLTRRTLVRLVYLAAHDREMAQMERSFQSAKTAPLAGATAVWSATRLLPVTENGTRPNLVLVLVESWGLVADSVTRDALAEPYADPELLTRYRVISGSTAFYGPTVGGEGRELCGNRIAFHLLNASRKELQQCLPNRLESLGYTTIAAHGLEGSVFSRSDWYPTIGFKETFFRQQFEKMGLPLCAGAFTGICDADIAAWIGRRLAAGETKPDFIYWVTLNSHLPVPIPTPLPHAVSCDGNPLLAQAAPLCSWYQLVANVHQSVARVALTDLARPTEFVIVGDHAPPFADAALRKDFSYSDVPYVLLIPRQVDQQTELAHMGAKSSHVGAN